MIFCQKWGMGVYPSMGLYSRECGMYRIGVVNIMIKQRQSHDPSLRCPHRPNDSFVFQYELWIFVEIIYLAMNLKGKKKQTVNIYRNIG